MKPRGSYIIISCINSKKWKYLHYVDVKIVMETPNTTYIGVDNPDFRQPINFSGLTYHNIFNSIHYHLLHCPKISSGYTCWNPQGSYPAWILRWIYNT